MGRTASVTYDSVEAVCFGILQHGEMPTVQRVRQALEYRGSTDIISKHLKTWRQALGNKMKSRADSAPTEVSTGVAKAWTTLLMQIRVEAFTLAESKLSEREAKAASDVSAACEARDSALARVASLEAAAELQTSEIARANSEVSRLTSLLSSVESLLASAREENRLLGVQVNDLRDRHEARLSEMADTHRNAIHSLQEELRLERERGAGERVALMEQTDRLRQEKDVELSELRKHVEATEFREAYSRSKLEAANQALVELHAKAERLESELKFATSGRDTLEAECIRLRARVGEIEGAVSSLSAKVETTQAFLAAESERANRAEAAARSASTAAASPRKRSLKK